MCSGSGKHEDLSVRYRQVGVGDDADALSIQLIDLQAFSAADRIMRMKEKHAFFLTFSWLSVKTKICREALMRIRVPGLSLS